MASKAIPVRKRSTILLACLFLGFLGIHRYLMGYPNWWLMTITLGGCCTWQCIDLVMILSGNLKMADGRELT